VLLFEKGLIFNRKQFFSPAATYLEDLSLDLAGLLFTMGKSSHTQLHTQPTKGAPPPGKTYLTIGQDLFSIEGYLRDQYNYSTVCISIFLITTKVVR
jgi:hypothetical protein